MKSTASCDDFSQITSFPKSFAWDWPFCDEGIARGMYTEEKFFVCLPFNNGGTGENSGSTKKFEKISESNFSWTIGLSNNSNEYGSTSFWRMELEIMKNLNMLALIVSRDISHYDFGPKRLKRVRKVYRLPNIYDVTTLRSTSYDWAIVIEALRRRDVRTNRPVPLKRSDTFT
uniref:LAGLIDADG homing endonuclease n=1 Tax=Panagrolaimus sp. JU765 TaxID=591449 RepID=A0AC34QU33_9BILA